MPSTPYRSPSPSTSSKHYFNIQRPTPNIQSQTSLPHTTMPPSVPPAPQLPQQALQEVFTYPDSSQYPVPGNKFSGARRLEIMGSSIAETVYMDVMRSRWPGASAAQLLVSPHPIRATRYNVRASTEADASTARRQ